MGARWCETTEVYVRHGCCLCMCVALRFEILTTTVSDCLSPWNEPTSRSIHTITGMYQAGQTATPDRRSSETPVRDPSWSSFMLQSTNCRAECDSSVFGPISQDRSEQGTSKVPSLEDCDWRTAPCFHDLPCASRSSDENKVRLEMCTLSGSVLSGAPGLTWVWYLVPVGGVRQ